MRKINVKKTIYSTVISCAALSLMTLFIIPFTLSAYVKDAESDGFYGEVSLRSYFECGTGRPKQTLSESDPGDPYVITRPRHLYNLSRLQGLGVFGEETYFQLGLVGLNGDTSGDPKCYLSDVSSTVVPFLDMSASNYNYEPINAIGSEAVPFFGEFDGQGLEIKNLTVYADPQDAGLFGYTAHGSYVHDLFLSEVTINALGYTDSFAALYGPTNAGAQGASFAYTSGETEETFDLDHPTRVESLEFDASDYFDWLEGGKIGSAPATDPNAPVIGYASTNPSYKYKILISGDFLVDNGDGTVRLDLPTIYDFFYEEKEKEGAGFPLQASSSISLVASTTDNYGLDHSRVVLTMVFDISLSTKDSEFLTMTAHIGEEHTNNIGLIIGHCDGSVSDCYVHNGSFVMNNGNTITGTSSYNDMENGSNYGLIGLIGGTVHNIAAEESDSGTSIGKDIGVLDFTTVYKEIIDEHSFDISDSTPKTSGIAYTPTASLKYKDYLRYDGVNYITLEKNSVSFNRKKVISNSDLGIFTIATNQSGTGMNEDAGNGLELSVVRTEDLRVDSKYYVYYETGEYQKGKGITFDKYRDSFNSYNPSEFHLGYHFPNADQITSESFEQRDLHQNYVFRFQVEGLNRTGKGFYFSDVDKESEGGSFVSKYFENKLVDENGHKIPASANSGRSGVMLRNSLGQEISSFSASFATPDLSYAGTPNENSRPKMFVIDNGSDENAKIKYPAANMVNFEVKKEVANVTVIAGLVDNDQPAALGVYKLDGETRYGTGDAQYVKKWFEDPDYAFFIPTDDHLAYFDYKVETVAGERVGKIGVYANENENSWTEADIHTDATIPNAYGRSGEFGYSADKTRLYAHTFKLPEGKYCLGSATGTSRDSGAEGIAKIFYVCAQGQTDGQISFDDNAFASKDEVKDVDFIKKECYTYSEGVVTQNITLDKLDLEHDSYNPSGTEVENQRCYVALSNSDRSTFDDAYTSLRFEYDSVNNKFVISSSTLSSITYLSVSNYALNHGLTGLTNMPVKVFSKDDSAEEKITYPDS